MLFALQKKRKKAGNEIAVLSWFIAPTSSFIIPILPKTFGIIIPLLLLAACSPPPATAPQTENRYFDLAGFIDKEVARLQELKPEVEKTVTLNGQSETKTISDIDWAQELQAFRDGDINKAAWRDSYNADSTVVTTLNGDSTVVVYSARSEALPVQSIVAFFGGTTELVEITIKRQSDNFLYTSKQTLKYSVDKEYRLENNQETVLIGEKKVMVVGKFVP